MDRFNQLKSLIDTFEKDFEKFYDKENKAAGVRVRKHMQTLRQFAQQMLSARHRTGKRITHAHGDGGQRRGALLHHIEMGVKGRDLVNFRERELHLMGERREMGRREPPVFVLDEMEILDQEIAPALALAEERAHLGERNRIDLPPLWRARRPAPSAGWLVSDEGHNPSAFRHC